jgi:hypothetical protein
MQHAEIRAFCAFMKHSVILCDQLQIVMKVCVAEREDKGSLEHHINRKFMVNAHQDSEI